MEAALQDISSWIAGVAACRICERSFAAGAGVPMGNLDAGQDLGAPQAAHEQRSFLARSLAARRIVASRVGFAGARMSGSNTTNRVGDARINGGCSGGGRLEFLEQP